MAFLWLLNINCVAKGAANKREIMKLYARKYMYKPLLIFADS